MMDRICFHQLPAGVCLYCLRSDVLRLQAEADALREQNQTLRQELRALAMLSISEARNP